MGFRVARKDRTSDGLPPERRSRWRGRTKRLIGGAVSTALVASSMIVVGGTLTAAPAAAAEPFLCTPGAVYVQSATEVREFAVNEQGGTLGATSIGLGHSDNGLGLSADGTYAYTVTNVGTDKVLAKHDRRGEGTTTRTPFTLGTSRTDSSVLRGAVHPVTGVYYFASGTLDGAINLYAWNESVTPQTYVQVGKLRPTTGSSAFGANGDMAFSASGQLVLVADRYIYSADLPATLQPSTATIDAKQVHDMGAGVQGNGIAFGNLGHIFVSVGGTNPYIVEVDLPRGQTVNTTSLGSFSPTDMASCTFPNTLTLKKDLPEGRHAGTDQFGLRVQSPVGYQVAQTDAVTRGDRSGLQPDYVGPVFTNQGDTFRLSESAAGSTDLTKYDASLVCLQVNADGSTTPVAVTADGQVTQPSGPLGTDVTCTYTNVRLAPDLALRKTSDPADGTAVQPGQRLTYTVQAENTGNTRLDPVTVTDDLSGVLANAEYQGDVATAIDGDPVSSGAATVTGDDLAWTGALEPGQVLTITYSVVVDEGVEGERIANGVTASGTPPGGLPPITPPAVTTEHPVAGFEVAKTSDPAAGTVVEPGQTIEYTVTGTNTGATVLNPATVTDDLSGVLASAAFNDDITTTVGGTTVTTGGATLTGNALAWTGTLQPGQTVTITYSVTVGDDTSGEILRNSVTGSGTPTTPNPGDPTGPQVPGDPIVPPTVTTEHPVIGSGFTISKSADPASGTAVSAGDTITYTITGTNTGDTDLDPAEIVDDLSGVLGSAGYNDDVTADRGSVRVADATLTWTGAIPRGESVTIRYTVTVDAGVEKALLHNVVTGSATPQIPTDPADPSGAKTPGTPIVPPAAETEHPVVDTGFEVTKSADPASGTAVRAGDTITYTVSGVNTGNTVLDPATIVDDLSAVLANAEYGGDAKASSGSVTLSGTTLTWTGTLAPGDRVDITYTVTVDEEATGVLLRNTVSGEGTPLIPTDPTDPESPTTPGTPVETPPATTEHPVATPGFTVTKTADPATGTRVDPGTVITYTVTGRNTGDTVLDPVEIGDDLRAALAHAAYNDDVSATRGDVRVADGALSWNGVLRPGQDVVITYSVTVDATAGGETIANTATGEATPLIPADPSDPESPTTPGTPITPPPSSTEHPVNEPGFAFAKTVDPAAGTAVDPGDVLTYTLTAVNTGQTALDPVTITDDLSGVLPYATFNADAVASIAGAAAAPATLDGTELSWTGALAVGQTVTVTYSVTVSADGVGTVIENAASATATPPGGSTITPPPGVTTNPVNEPGFSVSKSVDPAAGTAVDPGSVLTYTVTGVNTGETALDPVTVTDDLSGVLAHAEYNDDATATIGGTVTTAPTVAEEGLSWTGALQVGETVTITYSVTVRADAGGSVIENSASGSATPPGGVPPIETPPATTENPVNEPGFELRKFADPASGTRVDPGSVVTYTVTGVNTGETALAPVRIVDDLSGVLAHAAYNGDATATLSDGTAATPVVAGDELTWTGDLAVGERVTITYSVTVHGDAGGVIIANTVEGTATPPGGAELTPPPVTTDNPVGTPGFAFVKTSDPASGSAVATGSVVTYTLTGTNTGETGLDEVVVTDDLAGVLRHADLRGSATATVGDRAVAAPTIDGTTLRWTGSLAEGERVVITYAVTVHADAAGATLRNAATASATPPGGETITPPTSTTENPVLTPLALTGGQLAPWVLGLAIALLIGGAVLLLVRRRRLQS
ncbi:MULTISPECIES: isopeptide-forming domain-containing fimbrial protein [unclassified Microbacterium]|uniref:beta strand repeat-containing protein n=1 Tax=unclassified Microbacterium TaxID=2609290 RepID=UPI0021A26200|nr:MULTISPECIES: isopeptide-forming domain-containing fimbrial protein [unclassified Microbacterium]MCT1363492.1 isopeptide-forming domain-containing fimbrial protein [Microbacterium sp. p3-SID131]MCT1377094.1 isopeptide-forming domain-containing fimbrial protein [Microbacterium sp. p3-SID337]